MNLSEMWVSPARLANQYSISNESGNRSSKRTDLLNEEFIELLKNVYFDPKKWSYETEVAMPCSRGRTFKVDVLVRSKKNPKIIHVFSLKAVEKSFNKNRQNYANTISGEAMRLLAGDTKYSNCSFNWVDWIPREVPVGSKTENPNPCDQQNELTLLQNSLEPHGHKNCSITFSKIRYDLDSTIGSVEGWEPLHEILTKRAK